METLTLTTDYGLVRSSVFATLIRDLGGGYEQRASKAPSGGLARFKLVFQERPQADIETYLYDFYVARKGRLESFYLPDPFNPAVNYTVRFDQELSEEQFYDTVENSQIEFAEVKA